MYTAMRFFISMPSYKTNSCANSEILYRALLNGFAAQVSNHSKEVTYNRRLYNRFPMTLVEDDFGSQIVWCPCQKLQNSIGDVPTG
jgi:hypothetical protein